MTKIKRPNLSRGTKLLVNHIHTPLSAVASDINAGTVGEENLQEKSGVFRINLHVPYLANDFARSQHTQVRQQRLVQRESPFRFHSRFLLISSSLASMRLTTR